MSGRWNLKNKPVSVIIRLAILKRKFHDLNGSEHINNKQRNYMAPNLSKIVRSLQIMNK